MNTLAPAGTSVSTVPLFDRWLMMWNDDPRVAREIIAPDLTTHLPKVGMPPLGQVHDPVTMEAWVTAFRSSFESGTFRPLVGPLRVDNLLVCHWQFTGIWRGGHPPTATAPHGTPVEFRGVDMLRVHDGLVAEYWLTDNQLDLYAQIGAYSG